jgi:gluconokinase
MQRAHKSLASRYAVLMVVILMGVSGSGKTTVGTALAHELGWGFFDADDFHSAANVAKMRAGHPLDSQDREPWLAALSKLISGLLEHNVDAVLACSALTERARQVLIYDTDPARVKLVHLTGSPELLRARLAKRAQPLHAARPLREPARRPADPEGGAAGGRGWHARGNRGARAQGTGALARCCTGSVPLPSTPVPLLTRSGTQLRRRRRVQLQALARERVREGERLGVQ